MRKIFITFISFVTIMSFLVGCSGTTNPTSEVPETDTSATEAVVSDEPVADEEPVSARDTLVIVTTGDPGRLRSDTINNLVNLPYNRLVYDYLFTRNDKGEYVPCIAESYELDEDNLGVTLYLRQG